MVHWRRGFTGVSPQFHGYAHLTLYGVVTRIDGENRFHICSEGCASKDSRRLFLFLMAAAFKENFGLSISDYLDRERERERSGDKFRAPSLLSMIKSQRTLVMHQRTANCQRLGVKFAQVHEANAKCALLEEGVWSRLSTRIGNF